MWACLQPAPIKQPKVKPYKTTTIMKKINKTKRILLPLAAALVCLLAAGCDPEPGPEPSFDPITVLDTLPPDTVWVSPPYDTAAALEGRVWRSEKHYPKWFREGNTVQLRQYGYAVTTTLLGDNHFRAEVFNNTGEPIEGFADGASFRYILRKACEILPNFATDHDTLSLVILPLDAPAEADTATAICGNYGSCCYMLQEYTDTTAFIVIPTHIREIPMTSYFYFTKITR